MSGKVSPDQTCGDHRNAKQQCEKSRCYERLSESKGGSDNIGEPSCDPEKEAAISPPPARIMKIAIVYTEAIVAEVTSISAATPMPATAVPQAVIQPQRGLRLTIALFNSLVWSGDGEGSSGKVTRQISFYSRFPV
jgi:hypothetical protein